MEVDLQETLTIPEREVGHENKLKNMNPEKEMPSDKNDVAKDLMARELSKMGLTPQAISRLLNLKNLGEGKTC